MIKYLCNTCGSEVSELHQLVDITTRLSSRTREEWRDAGLYQEQVCARCVQRIKRFIATLRPKPDQQPAEQPDVIASIQ
jgi:DNA-directed RNA polymerase subunit RPC12/RpoP